MLDSQFRIRVKVLALILCGALLTTALVFCERLHLRNEFRARFYEGRLEYPVVNLQFSGQQRSVDLPDPDALAFLNARIAHITRNDEVAITYTAAVKTADGREVRFEVYVKPNALLFQTPSNDLIFEGYPDNAPIYRVDISSAPPALKACIDFLLNGDGRGYKRFGKDRNGKQTAG